MARFLAQAPGWMVMPVAYRELDWRRSRSREIDRSVLDRLSVRLRMSSRWLDAHMYLKSQWLGW